MMKENTHLCLTIFDLIILWPLVGTICFTIISMMTLKSWLMIWLMRKCASLIFFKCLAHYLNGCCISNCKHKAVKLAILAEARTYVWSPGPMKRAKQEDIIMRKNLHIVNNIEDEPFENKPVCDAMHTNYKRSKKGGGSLLPLSIGNRRWKLIISAKFWQNFWELAICPNYLGVQLRLGTWWSHTSYGFDS